VTVVVALVGLAAGFALGLQSRGASVGGVILGGGPPALAAGALDVAPRSGAPVTFSLPVHNAGDATVDVAVAAVPGVTVLGTARVRVAAGTWSEVSFGVQVDCTASVPEPRVVTLAVGDDRRLDVGLPDEGGRVVGDLHDARCAPQRPLTRDRLAGVWLVERVYGRWTGMAGRLVVVFRRDGSLLSDPAGVRFTANSGVLGRYRLRGPLLDAVERGFTGYACLPGDRAVWRAGQLPDGRVVLGFLHGGNCPEQPGELWVLRRMAPEDPG
jgi:hypothetical protein